MPQTDAHIITVEKKVEEFVVSRLIIAGDELHFRESNDKERFTDPHDVELRVRMLIGSGFNYVAVRCSPHTYILASMSVAFDGAGTPRVKGGVVATPTDIEDAIESLTVLLDDWEDWKLTNPRPRPSLGLLTRTQDQG